MTIVKKNLLIIPLFFWVVSSSCQPSEKNNVFEIKNYRLVQVDSSNPVFVEKYFIHKEDTAFKAHEVYGDSFIGRDFSFDGKLEGPVCTFKYNGDTISVSMYRAGIQEGERRRFHSNGKIQHQDFFRSGKRDGVSRTFDENGNLIKEEKWNMGKIVNE